MNETLATAVFGALVADAAALGVHWIYDPARIDDVSARSGSAAFVPIDGANYEGVPSYFAHGLRCDGMQSQYGEVLRLAMRSVLANGGFDKAVYGAEFAAYFGAGGRYQGYIDRPTRGALENIAAEVVPSGIDDDQLPAVATVPAIVAAYNCVDQGGKVAEAMQVTNVNTPAAQYGAVFVNVLNAVSAGTDLKTALADAARVAQDDIGDGLRAAIKADEADSVAYGEVTGRACHLPMAMPLAFHILARSGSFAEAIERNNRAGGDSCGRSIIIGSIMGAVHGLDVKTGIPLDWILQTHDAKSIWAQCKGIAA